MAKATPLVGIIMGSQSDWETMRHAAQMLDELQVPREARVLSAHRTPDQLFEYVTSAESRGLKVLIAGAGGAAHLAGVAAAKTLLPVLGVPVESKILRGVDSLFPSCKCRRASLSARSPSAKPARRMPLCSPRRFWHWGTPRCASA